MNERFDDDTALGELVNKLAYIRLRRKDAIDQAERDRFDEEAREILLDFINRAGDQFERWLPHLCPVVNVDMMYWKIGLDQQRQAAVAAALERFHEQKEAQPSVQPVVTEQATSESAATEAEPAAAPAVTTIPFHPLADLFPLVEGKDFHELVADIKVNGLHDAVVMLDGQILDGRNRYRACIAAGIEPRFTPFRENDALAFVISKNLKRGHLNESQRATVADKITNVRQGERTDLQHPANLPKVDQPRAAELLNVSERSVRSAKAVREKGVPALARAVEQGKLSVSAAAKATKLEPAEQEQVAALASEGKTKLARQVVDEVNGKPVAGTDPAIEGEADRQNADGTDPVAMRFEWDLSKLGDVGVVFDHQAGSTRREADTFADKIDDGDWKSWERVKAARAVAAAWQQLALRLEHAMSPPESGVRERCLLDLPELRVERIEDQLANLLSLEKTPAHKDVSRSWLKRIRVYLEDELIEAGVLPINARWRKLKARALGQNGDAPDDAATEAAKPALDEQTGMQTDGQLDLVEMVNSRTRSAEDHTQ
jgi:hypothetical protein